MAYIAPMQVLLEDIARTLGACSVTLPGCREEDPIRVSAAMNPSALDAYDSSHHELQQQHRRDMAASIRRRREEQLPVDIGGLDFGGALEEPPGAIPLRTVSSAYGERPPSWIARARRDGATVSMT